MKIRVELSSLLPYCKLESVEKLLKKDIRMKELKNAYYESCKFYFYFFCCRIRNPGLKRHSTKETA